MRKQLQHRRMPISIVLPVLLMLASGLLKPNSSLAAGSCTTTSMPCTDFRSGEMRLCVTTTCIDENGKLASTNTFVLLKRQGTKTPGGGHVPISTVTTKQQPSVGTTPVTDTQHGGGSGGGHK